MHKPTLAAAVFFIVFPLISNTSKYLSAIAQLPTTWYYREYTSIINCKSIFNSKEFRLIFVECFQSCRYHDSLFDRIPIAIGRTSLEMTS